MKSKENPIEGERKNIRNELLAFFSAANPQNEEKKIFLPSISISFHGIRKRGFALYIFSLTFSVFRLGLCVISNVWKDEEGEKKRLKY